VQCLNIQPTRPVSQEIDGTFVQDRSQCLEFTCNGTQDNNCNDGDATVRQWQVAFYNFDDMASSLLSVVEVAVMDNYMDDVAYFLMDATGKLLILQHWLCCTKWLFACTVTLLWWTSTQMRLHASL